MVVNEFRKMCKHILTGKDNETYDNSRVLCLLSFFIYFLLALGSLLVHREWGAMDFGGGISAMTVGFGVNLKLKSDTEPKAKDDNIQ